VGSSVSSLSYGWPSTTATPASSLKASKVFEKMRPLNRHARDPCYRSSLGVKQPIARIFVRLAPCPHVFRHPALDWPSQGETIRLMRSCGAARDALGYPLDPNTPASEERFLLFIIFSPYRIDTLIKVSFSL